MKATVIQHFSPSTKDTLTIVVTASGDKPPIEEQIAWMNAHPDSVYLSTFDLPDWADRTSYQAFIES